MQVWIVAVVLLFGIAEFYQWLQGLSLSMPLLAAAGVLLAIASNLNPRDAFSNLLSQGSSRDCALRTAKGNPLSTSTRSNVEE